jgi:hypothetical protein
MMSSFDVRQGGSADTDIKVGESYIIESVQITEELGYSP